jgi:hypothetical protein
LQLIDERESELMFSHMLPQQVQTSPHVMQYNDVVVQQLYHAAK